MPCLRKSNLGAVGVQRWLHHGSRNKKSPCNNKAYFDVSKQDQPCLLQVVRGMEEQRLLFISTAVARFDVSQRASTALIAESIGQGTMRH
jgi:hypothetical protein